MKEILSLILILLINSRILLAQSDKDQLGLEKIYQTTRGIRDSLISLHQAYSAQLKTVADSSILNELKEELRKTEKAIYLNKVEELKQELDFVRTHPSSLLSLEILSFKIYRQEASEYYPIFKSLFNKLSASLQFSEKGKVLMEALSHMQNSKVGSLAPSFTVVDDNNEQLSLSLYKNKKYILLDFWASWCIPCRQDFPFLKKAYENYSSKGFEIISISTDTDREKWIAAIEKDGIGGWKHFSLKDNSNSITSSYFVTSIPVKVLIDMEGRIIGRWRGGGDENKVALENLLRSIFEKNSGEHPQN